MTRHRESKERARPIRSNSSVEKRRATVSVRPLRLAFVINTGTAQRELIKYLAYNTSIWGGAYNCLIPTDGQSLSDDWWGILRRHDPDKVVFCGGNSPELIKQIEDIIQPFALLNWNDNVARDHGQGIDLFGCIPLRFVLWHVFEQEQPISQSDIRLPLHQQDSPWNLCIAAQIGALDESLAKVYTEALHAEYVDLEVGDLGGYLAALSSFSGRVSPLDMTRWNLSTLSESASLISGFSMVLYGENSIADACLFWNLRMSPAIVSKGTLLVPINTLRSQRNLQTLADWCNENVRGTNHMTLVSATVDRRRLARLQTRLKVLLKKQLQFVDVWYSGFSISQFQAYEAQVHEEVVVENRVFAFKNPLPTFGERTRSGMEWVTDADFREHIRPGRGYILPRYPQLNQLLAGEPLEIVHHLGGYRIRLAQGRLAFRVDKSTEYIRARLPEEEQLFTSLVHSRGYECRITDKCRYARGIIGLLGQYKDADILRETGLRDLLCAMRGGEAYTFSDMKLTIPRQEVRNERAMRGGEAYTFSEMKQFLKPGADASQQQRIEQLVADLTLKGVFLRGYNIRCPACDLRRWYSIHDVAETMNCAGCLTRLQPPIEAAFHYKLNELLVRGVDQGVIPVLMTVLVLSAFGDESFLFLPGVEIEKDGTRIDIDLLAACNGNLILAECKDLHKGYSPKTTEEIVEQLSAVVRIAPELGARIVFLSTLLDRLPQSTERGIAHLRSQYKDVAIHVMLRTDLERGHVTKPAGRILSPDGSDKQMPVRLEELFPRRERRRSGWLGEPGQRIMTF